MLILGAVVVGLNSCRPMDDPPPPRPKPIEYSFVDEFDNDNNQWAFADQDNYGYGAVSNGTFKISYLDDLFDAYYVSRDIGFNTQNNFKIYTRIGSDNNMGLLFGYNDATNSYGYSFMIDYDGYYALYDEGGNGYGNDVTSITELVTNRYVKGDGDWNEVVFEQRGSNWIGYINDVEVFRVPKERLAAGSVGFVLVPETQGEADYIQVDWWE